MKDRILSFLQAEGLKSSKFAEILGVQASTISHILSGRNKPGLDLLEKMLLRFPRLNPYWLILGHGDMYSDATKVDDSSPISDTLAADMLDGQSPIDLFSPNDTPILPDEPRADSAQRLVSRSDTKVVEKVVIFYNDKTFVSYDPD